MKQNAEISKLKTWLIDREEPADFLETSNYLFPELEIEDRKTSLFHLIEIGSSARPGLDSLPLLPIKYHLFARPPQGVWVCINPDCPGKEEGTHWSKVYSHPLAHCESCGKQVFPLHLCRECGQHYLVAMTEDNGITLYPAADEMPEGYSRRYLTWSEIHEDRALAEDSEDSDDEDSQGLDPEEMILQPKFLQEDTLEICLECFSTDKRRRCGHPTSSIPLWEVKQSTLVTRRGEKIFQTKPVSSLNECPRCRAKSKSETEVATAITVVGSGPLGNITYQLYRNLPASTNPVIGNRPGAGRKLLTFYDSRQSAARFAAYLQDITNKQIYRHILPKAVSACKQEDEWGKGSPPDLFKFASKAGEIALEEGVLINDLDFNTEGVDYYAKSSENLKQAAQKLARIILGEFTTGRKSRQSLESIGSIGVFYFLPTEFNEVDKTAEQVGLNGSHLREFISTLLDDLRFKKAVKLPTGVNFDDEEFGTNKSNPFFIRTGAKTKRQDRWIGIENRAWRIKYTQLFLQKENLPHSPEDARFLLDKIWVLLTEEVKGFFTGSPQNGYQLDPKHIFFNNEGHWSRCKKCQRLSFRESNVPCGSMNCGGELEEVDPAVVNDSNYYYQVFQEQIIPLRVEEHTAQISPEKGQRYQKEFKDGKINVLSCSTTFEMGINLGDLQAVSLCNVPPSVANYRQRAGRAGRNLNGTSFIMTWASDRPHDQTYYDHPGEIISGAVKVPTISITNEVIARRHINAFLLSDFLQYLYNHETVYSELKYCRPFFTD